jgi:hypothetical protein
VGDLSSYSPALGRGVGLLDAWWTTPSTSPTAPVGDRVTVRPFLAASRPGQRAVFDVHVEDGAGASVTGAGVDWVPQPAGTSSMGMSSMGMSASGMGTTTAVTDSSGNASYTLQRPDQGAYDGLQVVVTRPGSGSRVAGEVTGELLTAPVPGPR